MKFRSFFSVLMPAPAACCGGFCTDNSGDKLPKVLGAITAGSVSPLDETAGQYFAREKVEAVVADAMLNPRGSFVTVTGASGNCDGNRFAEPRRTDSRLTMG